MSYTKVTNPPFDPTDVLNEVAAQCVIKVNGIAAELVPAGQFVTLNTGETVWVGCVLHDNPDTPMIEFLCVAFACDGLGPKRKDNGQIVCIATWRVVAPELVDLWGVPLIRKAAMMIALEEQQPQVNIPNPIANGPGQQDLFVVPDIDKSAASIRTALRTAAQISNPLTDVL